MKNIQHIFFDLDHTLWDFEHNSRETLFELIAENRRHIGEALDFDRFFFFYRQTNKVLWELYRTNRIGRKRLREVRFVETFEKLGIEKGSWMEDFGDEYLARCPKKTKLMDHAVETLEALAADFELHIITNGFSTTQSVKIQHAGLAHYFKVVITSENAQAKKPQVEIFEYALNATGANRENALYIGDSYEADVIGGLAAGLKTIYFNPDKKVNPLRVPEVQTLRQLPEILGK